MRSTRRPLEIRGGLIWLDAALTSSDGELLVEPLVLDTGSANSILCRELAEELGLAESRRVGSATFDTPDGPVLGYTVRLPRVKVLGREVQNYLVGVKTFHARLHVAGVLGLDFFEGTELLLSFRTQGVHLAW
jgi:hypothetical protein